MLPTHLPSVGWSFLLPPGWKACATLPVPMLALEPGALQAHCCISFRGQAGPLPQTPGSLMGFSLFPGCWLLPILAQPGTGGNGGHWAAGVEASERS